MKLFCKVKVKKIENTLSTYFTLTVGIAVCLNRN